MYDASVHLTHMISNHIPLIDAPRDTMHLLWNRVEQTYHNVSRVDIHSIQKESYIYTSFVYYMLNQSMGKSQPDVLYAHVQIILNIIEQNKESEDIYEYIVQLLTPFMQNQAIKELAMYTQSERAIFCVVEYIKFLCHQIQFVLSEEESLENIEEHSDTAEKIVQETSRVLSHFPDFHLYQDELLDAGHTVFCHAAGYKAHEIPAFLSATKH